MSVTSQQYFCHLLAKLCNLESNPCYVAITTKIAKFAVAFRSYQFIHPHMGNTIENTIGNGGKKSPEYSSIFPSSSNNEWKHHKHDRSKGVFPGLISLVKLRLTFIYVRIFIKVSNTWQHAFSDRKVIKMPNI